MYRDRVLLPADTIKLYDPDGKLMTRLIAYQTRDPHSQSVMKLVTHPFHAQTHQKRAVLMNLARLTVL